MLPARTIALLLPMALSMPTARALPAVPVQAGRVITVGFFNHTQEVRVLYVTTPAGRQLIGTFSEGGSLKVTIPVPAGTSVDVSWEAGSMSGSFTIGPDSPGFLRIDLTRKGPVGP